MKQYIAFFTVIIVIIISTTFFAVLRNQTIVEDTPQNEMLPEEKKTEYTYTSTYLPFVIESYSPLEVYDENGLSTSEQDMSSIKTGARYGMDLEEESIGIVGVSKDYERIDDGISYEYVNSFSIDGNNIRLNFPNANSLETLITSKITAGNATLYFFENEQALSANGPLAVMEIPENSYNIESLGFYAESESILKEILEDVQIRITQ